MSRTPQHARLHICLHLFLVWHSPLPGKTHITHPVTQAPLPRHYVTCSKSWFRLCNAKHFFENLFLGLSLHFLFFNIPQSAGFPLRAVSLPVSLKSNLDMKQDIPLHKQVFLMQTSVWRSKLGLSGVREQLCIQEMASVWESRYWLVCTAMLGSDRTSQHMQIIPSGWYLHVQKTTLFAAWITGCILPPHLLICALTCAIFHLHTDTHAATMVLITVMALTEIGLLFCALMSAFSWLSLWNPPCRQLQLLFLNPQNPFICALSINTAEMMAARQARKISLFPVF